MKTVGFELLGAKLVGINAEPALTYSEVASFSVPCKDQAEVDVAPTAQSMLRMKWENWWLRM